MSLLTSSAEEITLHELLLQGENILKAYHRPDASIDAKLLMRYLLGCQEIALILNRSQAISRYLQESYMYLIAKRTQGMPLQYITKSQEFMGLDFYVDERVLIPRQDTETLVETIVNYAKRHPVRKIIDIGSGSGCIGISLAYYIKDVKVTAIDVSQEALDVTMKNAVAHGVDDRITAVKSNLLNDCPLDLGSADLIISNPPYISKEECKELMQEVSDYEPRIALTDEADGLTFYREISKQAKAYLKDGGLIAYEIGCSQAQAVKAILTGEGYKEIEVIKDLTGKDRVVTAKK